jgi:signal transduction histidine kinase
VCGHKTDPVINPLTSTLPPMPLTISFKLNIRQKVSVGLVVCLLLVVGVAVVSFQYLQDVERKLHFVQVADDLSNIILEIRRYEKNFLLYAMEEDLTACVQYVQNGREVLSTIASEITYFQAAPLVSRLQRAMDDYDATMRQAQSVPSQGLNELRAKVEERLREQGKLLVDLSNQLVDFERKRIINLIRSLKTQLFFTISIVAVAGLFLTVVVGKKIFRPLKVIEDTTRRIAQGDFHHIPVTNSRDETQRVVEAFNRMVAELEKRQEQLLQTRKLSSLGILASGIAHQLNNPLNNIATSCQILSEELEGGELEFNRRMLTNIDQEVFRARDIVKGLLEFSRAREFTLSLAPLSEAVNRAVRLISSQTPPGVDIIKEVPAELVLNLDIQRMQEVFLNLIMNSIQAIEKPPGQIRISAERDAAAREAVIRVEDTGCGIRAEDLSRVFDPFFTTKQVGAGTGLGLSVVYGIIEKHHGSISVQSLPNEGTRFIIRLPLPAEA